MLLLFILFLFGGSLINQCFSNDHLEFQYDESISNVIALSHRCDDYSVAPREQETATDDDERFRIVRSGNSKDNNYCYQGPKSYRRLFSSVCAYLLMGSLLPRSSADDTCSNGKWIVQNISPDGDKEIEQTFKMSQPDMCSYGYGISESGNDFRWRWVFASRQISVDNSGIRHEFASSVPIDTMWMLGSEFSKEGVGKERGAIKSFEENTYDGVKTPLEYRVFSTPDCKEKGFTYRIVDFTPRKATPLACDFVHTSHKFLSIDAQSVSQIWHKGYKADVELNWTYQCGQGGDETIRRREVKDCIIEAKHYGFCVNPNGDSVKQLVHLYCQDQELAVVTLKAKLFSIIDSAIWGRYFDPKGALVEYVTPGKILDNKCTLVPKNNQITKCVDGVPDGGTVYVTCNC